MNFVPNWKEISSRYGFSEKWEKKSAKKGGKEELLLFGGFVFFKLFRKFLFENYFFFLKKTPAWKSLLFLDSSVWTGEFPFALFPMKENEGRDRRRKYLWTGTSPKFPRNFSNKLFKVREITSLHHPFFSTLSTIIFTTDNGSFIMRKKKFANDCRITNCA